MCHAHIHTHAQTWPFWFSFSPKFCYAVLLHQSNFDAGYPRVFAIKTLTHIVQMHTALHSFANTLNMVHKISIFGGNVIPTKIDAAKKKKYITHQIYTCGKVAKTEEKQKNNKKLYGIFSKSSKKSLVSHYNRNFDDDRSIHCEKPREKKREKKMCAAYAIA